MDKLIADLDQQFSRLHHESGELLGVIEADLLYCRPPGSILSSGEEILRSAAAVEQTFGGLTTNLWDDPFEWTLPETLSTPKKVADYLSEVEATRKRGFALFKNDADLLKEIMAPAGMTKLQPLLLDTLRRARHHLVNAQATYGRLRAKDEEQSAQG